MSGPVSSPGASPKVPPIPLSFSAKHTAGHNTGSPDSVSRADAYLPGDDEINKDVLRQLEALQGQYLEDGSQQHGGAASSQGEDATQASTFPDTQGQQPTNPQEATSGRSTPQNMPIELKETDYNHAVEMYAKVTLKLILASKLSALSCR